MIWKEVTLVSTLVFPNFLSVINFFYRFSHSYWNSSLILENIAEGQLVKYKVIDLPITVPTQKPAADKPNPKQGIGKISQWMRWSLELWYSS